MWFFVNFVLSTNSCTSKQAQPESDTSAYLDFPHQSTHQNCIEEGFATQNEVSELHRISIMQVGLCKINAICILNYHHQKRLDTMYQKYLKSLTKQRNYSQMNGYVDIWDSTEWERILWFKEWQEKAILEKTQTGFMIRKYVLTGNG